MKIEDYVNTLEREIIQRKAVLSMCENSEIFYDEQFKEAKIVANVSSQLDQDFRWMTSSSTIELLNHNTDIETNQKRVTEFLGEAYWPSG